MAWHGMLDSVKNSMPLGPGDEPFQFVGAYPKDEQSSVIAQQGIDTVGKLNIGEWFTALGDSKVLLGVGEPYLSPSRACLVTDDVAIDY
jgi:hypothetical protein